MMLAPGIAEKLLLLARGGQLPASALRHPIVAELTDEGIIASRLAGRTKSVLYITNADALNLWLYNRYSIPDLAAYIQTMTAETATRADMAAVSGQTKLRDTRVWQGFMAHSYMQVPCTLHGADFVLTPTPGLFHFVVNYKAFVPRPHVVVVGIENAESFAQAQKLRYLLPGIIPLFVSRYPQQQGKDLMAWLAALPNSYLHMGDYDFAGINIYLQEYKKHLGDRATFFIPPHIDHLLTTYGNRHLYDIQTLNNNPITEPALHTLIALLHHHKKCLEQEVLLLGEVV